MKKKFLRLGALALVLSVVGGLAAMAIGAPWGFNTGSASATGGLTCSVKPACGAGEVAVFRMSGLANAHAGTAGGSAYANVVCCAGPAGLSASCSGSHETVLWLSAPDNAHVSETSGGAYTTEVCLSATGTTMNCQYRSSCGGDACLATISGATNAHVADCDGVDDYATKVCCGGGGGGVVGGAVKLPPGAVAAESGAAAEGSGWGTATYAALVGGMAAAAAIGVGGWYARRRWLR